jgi:uncharacterized protein
MKPVKQLPRIANYPAPVRILAFLVAAIVCWSPFAAIIYLYLQSTQDLASPPGQNSLNIFIMGGLGGMVLVLLPWWLQRVHGPGTGYGSLGLRFDRRNGVGLVAGWLLGLSSLGLLYGFQESWGWLAWQPAALPWVSLIGGGLLSSWGVSLAEEILFRGWMLDELERDYPPAIALWSNALIFAALHFGNLGQIPGHILGGGLKFWGLTVLGLVLVVARRSQNYRLGAAIGLHAGLIGVIYLLDVGKLAKFTQRVPDWVTGNGTPAAGLVGIIALLGLLGYFLWLDRRRQGLGR